MIIYPNSGALWGAGLLRTALAGAEVHLFKSGAGIVMDRALTIAELALAEADYTGYVSQVVAAWNLPLLNPLGGASIDSGVLQWSIADPYTVPGSVGGGWVETAAGVLVCAWDYATPRNLVGPGDGFPTDLLLLFG